MAGLANGGSVMEFVAINADAHRGHAGYLGHGGQIRHLSVAGFAFSPGCEMFAVRPVHTLRNRVDAHPRNGLARLCKRGELLNRGLLRRDRTMAGHASGGRRKSHQISGLGISVAGFALEAESQVGLMAVRDRLHGRSVLAWIVGHIVPRFRGSRGLPRIHRQKREEQRRSQCGRRDPGYQRSPFTSHGHSSRSFRETHHRFPE